MKFSVKEKPLAVAPPQAPMTVEQVSAAYEDLMCSYMELTDAQRNLDEVCQVMENIELSMKMIKTGGMDAVKLLNIDKSLEGLCAIVEEKLTVQAAEEGLGDAIKTGLNQFVEWIKKVLIAIRDFFFNKSKVLDAKAAAKEADTNTLNPDDFVGDATVSSMYGFTYESLASGLLKWRSSFVPALNELSNQLDKLPSLIGGNILDELNHSSQSIAALKKVNDCLKDLGIFIGKDGNGKFGYADKNGRPLLFGDHTVEKNLFNVQLESTYTQSGWNGKKFIEMRKSFASGLKELSTKYAWYSESFKKAENDLIRAVNKSDTDKTSNVKDLIIDTFKMYKVVGSLESSIQHDIERCLEEVKKNCF